MVAIASSSHLPPWDPHVHKSKNVTCRICADLDQKVAHCELCGCEGWEVMGDEEGFGRDMHTFYSISDIPRFENIG